MSDNADRIVETLARHNDRYEIAARAVGAFGEAVCFQHFAEWYRDGTGPRKIHGIDAKVLLVEWSDNKPALTGDMLEEPGLLLDISRDIYQLVCDRLGIGSRALCFFVSRDYAFAFQAIGCALMFDASRKFWSARR